MPPYAANPVQGYRAATILYYDELTGRGYYVHRDMQVAKERYRAYKAVRRLLKRDFARVVAEYKEKYSYMCSRKMWEKYLER